MNDPFKKARQKQAAWPIPIDGETMPMILRHADVKAAAKDWKTFSSNAPFRVPIPSEESVRSVRQLPIETNPPEHTEYRQIVEPFFRRPQQPEFVARVEALISELIDQASGREDIEIVREFALPLQSRALTYLLGVEETEAEEWIRWGIHVFRDGADGSKKGAVLEDYIVRRFEQAANAPGDDFFSALHQATYQGRPLTEEEKIGFANLTFAGGRDTIINSVAFIMGYLGKNPAALESLRGDPKRIMVAGEEFFRVVTPLTHIGRVCPVDTEVHDVPVKAEGRVSLCWASANYDETVFDEPEAVRLDRKPNPHIAFGSGAHLCLGALHARLIIRSLLKKISERVDRIEILHAQEHLEVEADYQREVGYDRLTVRMIPGEQFADA